MGYRFWTAEDMNTVQRLQKAIHWEQIGMINIGGVRDSHGQEIKGKAYIFRVYDRNETLHDRCAQAPFTEKAVGGGVRGLVMCLASYLDTDFDCTNMPQGELGTVADPSVVWIATRYIDGVRDAAAQMLGQHQEYFHKHYYTVGKNGDKQPALNSDHIYKFILPSCEKAYRDEIREADMRNDR